MMEPKGKRIYVHENFVRMLKVSSAVEGKSLVQFTEEVSKRGEFKVDKEKLKREFDFRF